MRFSLIIACVLSLCVPAYAGFEHWTTSTEDDPFSGGKKVTVDYMSSMRSGVLIFCDTSVPGVEIRAVPGFEYSSDIESFIPTASFAVDGKRLFDSKGEVGAVGSNLVAVSFKLDTDRAREFVEAFKASKKQIAIKDGVSDRPHLLIASGSTKSGQALKACIDAQK